MDVIRAPVYSRAMQKWRNGNNTRSRRGRREELNGRVGYRRSVLKDVGSRWRCRKTAPGSPDSRGKASQILERLIDQVAQLSDSAFNLPPSMIESSHARLTPDIAGQPRAHRQRLRKRGSSLRSSTLPVLRPRLMRRRVRVVAVRTRRAASLPRIHDGRWPTRFPRAVGLAVGRDVARGR